MKEKKENKTNWIFTFGKNQINEGHYVKICGTYSEARKKMMERFGRNWAFQYSEEEWEDMKRRFPVELETELL